MPHFYGKESGYLKNNTVKYSLLALGIFLVTIPILIVATIFNFQKRGNYWLTYPVALGVIVVFFIYRKFFKQAAKESISFLNGLLSESNIAKLLKQLSDDYWVYQDITVPGKNSNIDFVVIGPTGIFTIEVKSHLGVVEFNGQELTRNGQLFEKDIFKQAINEATSLHDYLELKAGDYIFINPIIVFSSPGAQMHFGKNKVGDRVYIIQQKWLLDLITTINGQKPANMASINQILEGLVKT